MTLAEVSTLLAVIGAVTGGAFFLDDRHAHDTDIKKLVGGYNDQFQVIQKSFQDVRLDQLRQRLWYLQERGLCTQDKALRECRFIQNEIDKIVRETTIKHN